MYIESTHIFVPHEDLRESPIEYEKRLTVISKYDDHQAIPMYAHKPGQFGFPRYYLDPDKFFGKGVDETSHGLRVPYNFTSRLRKRQEPLVRNFVGIVKDGGTGVLVHAGTGTGKTVMALAMLGHLKTTALIVVPRDRILHQWIERIIEHTDISSDEIGIAQQDKCEFLGKKVVVGMVHSLCKDRYPEEFKKYFGAVVFDECHVLSAKTFSETVGMFPARYRIGLSATPDRKDGMEDVFRWAIAEHTLYMSGGADLVPRVLVYEYAGTSVPQKLSFISGRLNRRGVIISALANDIRRNAIIAHFADRLYKSGRRTVVFSDRERQIEILYSMLTKKHRLSKRDVGIFTGSTPKKDRKEILDNCGIILATYGVMGMAIDVKELAGAVFGTPISDARQSIGRLLRRCAGKKTPVVIDIVDLTFKETVRWTHTRRKIYSSLGASIEAIRG